MSETAIIETRIDAEIQRRASAVLAEAGMSISDAVQLLLKRTADEGALPFAAPPEDPAYDAWFRAKVQEALDDPRPPLSDEFVREHFAKRHAELERLAIERGE
ncbi:MAG: addiction module antitoxin, RelB/DinJ family [Devosia sp.]|nr:addiction module antitoxin, RelB/DinJ family [Devosia sp.]